MSKYGSFSTSVSKKYWFCLLKKAISIFYSMGHMLPVAHPKCSPFLYSPILIDPKTVTDYSDRYCRNSETCSSTDFCSTENYLLLHNIRPCQIFIYSFIQISMQKNPGANCYCHIFVFAMYSSSFRLLL